MSTSILLDTSSAPQTAPISLNVHLAIILNVTAEDARRLVNRQVVTELGTGLVARDPELSITGDQIMWRVPIVLSLPNLGDLGQVGSVAVDARTGKLALDPDERARIVQHAHRLYTGATLPAE